MFDNLPMEQRVLIIEILDRHAADDWTDFDNAMEREIEMQLRYNNATR